MATELPRPGVEVVQEFKSAAPSIVRPTLVPFVCGPAKEVIEVTSADGTLNSDAKQGQYTQLPLTITQSAFPSPRGNIAQVDVEEDSIKAFFQFGGSLLQLNRDPGDAFLVAWNKASRAAVETLPASGDFAIDGLVLVLAIDVASALDTTADITVTFAGATLGANLTPQEACDQINLAVGDDVAVETDDHRVRIVSTFSGAKSSITVRAGGTANAVLGFNVSNEYRVTGSGFRGQDQSNDTTITPWVEWSRGVYSVNSTAASFPTITTLTPGYGLVDNAGTFTAGQASNVTFTGVGSIDLKVGDVFYADGVAPISNAVVKKVEAARFRLGVVNTRLSIFDDAGVLVSAVYDDANVSTLFGAAPFSPNYAWFQAKNLTTSTVPQAAASLGATAGAPAEVATISGTSAPTGPFSLTGLTLKFDVTIDGVAVDTQTFTFSGPPLADIAAVVAAIGTNITGVIGIDDAGTLQFVTTATGATQALTLLGTSSALATLGYVAATDVSATGKDVEFLDIPPVITGGTQTFALTPGGAGETLVINSSNDGGATWTALTRTCTLGAGPFANIAALLAEINTAGNWNGGTLPTTFLVTNSGNKLIITGTTGGSLQGLRIGSASTAIGSTSNSDLLFTSLQSDIGEENISGLTLKFQLNDRPKTYEALFTSNSINDAVDTINGVVGFTIASIAGTGTSQLKLTSDLKGQASKVVVVGPDVGSIKAANAFGFTIDSEVVGTGRPNPDFALDVSGNVVLSSDILRNPVSGQPYDPGEADLYIQYTGLRKDVSPAATNPTLISVSDVATLQTILNPLNANNPLGLGMFFMLINAPGVLCTGMGVDEAPAAAPEGTLAAYAKVANFLEAQEVYAIAPLTHDETVAQMFKAHVELMEEPEQKGERILFFNPLVPTRAVDTLIVSGLNGSSTATDNQFVTDVNPASALLAAGINPSNPIAVSVGLYLEITVEGNVRRYNVSAVNGVLISLNVDFASDENTDGFYTVTPLTETLVNVDYSMDVRGAPLVLPSSTILDKAAIATTVQAKASAYKYRRVFYTFPDKVRALVDGVDSLLEGYYACAAVAGMTAHFPPQQGFTNLPMVGFSGVLGSQDTFSPRQMNVMAAGGAYIFVQDAQGAPLISRMQVSTDTTTIEKRELSITKDVDFVSKFLRAGLRNFIGTFNITQPFLDTVSTVIHGMLKFLEENGIIISGDLNNIIQSKEQPDTVLVDILLDVPFPCNYIRLTLVI